MSRSVGIRGLLKWWRSLPPLFHPVTKPMTLASLRSGHRYQLVQIFILSKCIRRELSWGLWVVLLNYQIWEGHENPKTSSQLFRGGLGTLEHGAGIGRERSLRRTVSSPYGVCGNPGWLMSELHWSIFLNDWMNLLQSSDGGKSKQPPIFPEEAKWLSYPLSLWVKW